MKQLLFGNEAEKAIDAEAGLHKRSIWRQMDALDRLTPICLRTVLPHAVGVVERPVEAVRSLTDALSFRIQEIALPPECQAGIATCTGIDPKTDDEGGVDTPDEMPFVALIVPPLLMVQGWVPDKADCLKRRVDLRFDLVMQ